jgi:hypothetical protein
MRITLDAWMQIRLNNLKSRVRKLEREMRDLKKLLEIKDEKAQAQKIKNH